MYFNNSGKDNTENTIRLALEKAEEKNINNIVVASSNGYTAEFLKGCGKNVVVVAHAYGFKEPNKNGMEDDVKKRLESYGFKIYTSTHALSGVERAISSKFGGVYPVEIMAHTLRMLGQGMKVAVEIATMAIDAGLIPYGKDVISIGGTSYGADTAVVIRPGYGAKIFETKIREIICKPLEW